MTADAKPLTTAEVLSWGPYAPSNPSPKEILRRLLATTRALEAAEETVVRYMNSAICSWCGTFVSRDSAAMLEHIATCKARTDATEKDAARLALEIEAARDRVEKAERERDDALRRLVDAEPAGGLGS